MPFDARPVVRTRADLLVEGGGDSWIRQEQRTGRLVTYAPGVYVSGAPDLTAWAEAARAHTGPCVVTGWAGCLLLGIPGAEPQQQLPVLVAEGNRKVSTAYVRVLRTTRPPTWTELSGGIWVASPERCVVDAARALDDLASVRHLVLSAVAAGKVTVAALRTELRRRATRGRRRVERALLDAARGAASAPKAEVADLACDLAEAGRLPRFLLNPDVLRNGQLIGRPDGWFVDLGVGWEVDSQEHHGRPDDLDRTLVRDERFVLNGLLLLHVTPRTRRRRGTAYGAILEEAVGVCLAAPWQPPAGLAVVPRGPLLP